jgi:hypothetical protein
LRQIKDVQNSAQRAGETDGLGTVFFFQIFGDCVFAAGDFADQADDDFIVWHIVQQWDSKF